MLRRIFPYMKSHQIFLWIAVFFLVLDLVSNLAIPLLSRHIIDEVLYQHQLTWPARYAKLTFYVFFLGLAFFTLSLSIYLRAICIEWFSQRCTQDLRAKLFYHMQHLDIKFYHNTTTGELMSRLTSEIEKLRDFLSGGLVTTFWNLIFFPLATTYMMFLNWKLTLICLLLSPLIAALAISFARIGRVKQGINREAYADLSAVAQEDINGIRLIQGFVRQGYEEQRFQSKNTKLTEGRQSSLRTWALYMPMLEFLGGVSSVLALAIGGYWVVSGVFSIGMWIQFTGYTWMIVAPMRNLGDLITNFNFARVSLERLLSILDEPIEIRNPENPYQPEVALPEGISSIEQLPGKDHELLESYRQARGDIEFRGVSWRPHGKVVLEDINFKLKSGMRLGIIGETGAGKSSIVNLLCRFADPDEGQILLDGVDLREWDLKMLRKQISYVMQEPFLFSDTLAFNISFDAPYVRQDRVIRSAQRSAAHGFIASLQQGYQTIVGERGVGLSGGQRQRTALARALVKESPVLILDDTTSAVDMQTEKEIQAHLRDLETHNSILIVAHRMSSVQDCDEIIALQNGKIIERGVHQELMQQQGYYYKIFKEQQGSLL